MEMKLTILESTIMLHGEVNAKIALSQRLIPNHEAAWGSRVTVPRNMGRSLLDSIKLRTPTET